MQIDVNSRCCIQSDDFQWRSVSKDRAAPKDWRPFAHFRTLSYALDALVDKKLCTESELTGLRSLSSQLESTKRRIEELIGNRRDIPVPPEIQKFGCFMTAAGGLNYSFLKQVWQANSPHEIPQLAEKYVSLATNLAGNYAKNA